jgi:hypothetical protein
VDAIAIQIITEYVKWWWTTASNICEQRRERRSHLIVRRQMPWGFCGHILLMGLRLFPTMRYTFTANSAERMVS